MLATQPLPDDGARFARTCPDWQPFGSLHGGIGPGATGRSLGHGREKYGKPDGGYDRERPEGGAVAQADDDIACHGGG